MQTNEICLDVSLTTALQTLTRNNQHYSDTKHILKLQHGTLCIGKQNLTATVNSVLCLNIFHMGAMLTQWHRN